MDGQGQLWTISVQKISVGRVAITKLSFLHKIRNYFIFYTCPTADRNIIVVIIVVRGASIHNNIMVSTNTLSIITHIHGGNSAILVSRTS